MGDELASPSQQPSDTAAVEVAEQSMNAAVARSGLWGIGGRVAVLGATFLATPFTIRLLGPTKYGVWALLGTVLNYLMIADFGMADTSTTFAADAHARADDAGEAAAVWTATFITLSVTGAAAVIVGLFAPFLVAHGLHVRPPLRAQAVLSLRLVCFAALATAFAWSIATPQQVRLRWRSVTLAFSGPAILQVTLAPVVLVLLAGGVATMALLAALAAVGSAACNFVIAVRLAPALRRPRASRELARQMARYAMGVAISGLALIPLTTAERLFLAAFHTARTVAFYSVAATLGSMLLVLPFAVVGPLVPALVRLTAEGRVDEHRRLYEAALGAMLLVLTPLTMLEAFVAAPFLRVWAGPAYGVHSVVPFYIILGGFWFNALSYIPTVELMASRRTSTLAIVRVAEILPYLVAAALLSRAFGAIGAAVAWSLRSIVDAVVLFVFVRRAQGLGLPALRRRLPKLLVQLTLGAALLEGAAQLTESLLWRLAVGVLVLALYCASVWRFTLTDAERRRAAALSADALPILGRRR